ncbi:stress protein [Lelliottia aquatilis]|uniref:Dabb family protein n=1 Tax=Lelliottia aquatilis TaxID=2080838 RepID=UPI000CDF0F48|nr:Dabb family protein [Lelliottia aquatilis]POZ16183.1 stress protein [Lelliottia aquatilis]
MIRHVLFIQFKPDVLSLDVDIVRILFLGVRNKIEGVLDVEWGENDSPEMKNAGYTHCVFMTFADETARQKYLPHSVHEELKEIFKPLLQNIIVLDYTVVS